MEDLKQLLIKLKIKLQQLRDGAARDASNTTVPEYHWFDFGRMTAYDDVIYKIMNILSDPEDEI